MTHDQALAYSQIVFKEAIAEVGIEVMLETKMLYDRYQAHHKGWPNWEILGTEQKFDLAVTDRISIPMRYDLLVREHDTGRVLIVDYKFTYDFWSPQDHDLNGQAPKYISIMQNAALTDPNIPHVDGAALEEIRTRPLGEVKRMHPKNLWKRTFYYPSSAKKRNLLKQHISASLEIEAYRALPDKAQEEATIPALNKHGACKYCNFKELCISELDGGDITIAVELGFIQNTYGYNDQDTTTEKTIEL